MWSYEKRLQFPVRIKTPNAAAAKVIITQYGGPDGELGASMRYLSQRYTMPWRGVAGLLTDIGTEELAHLEMVSAIVYQLTKGLSADEIRRQGFDTYFVDHTAGVWPQAAGGTPFTSMCFASKGDAITDIQIRGVKVLERPRRDDTDTAAWFPSIQTDASGKATVSFREQRANRAQLGKAGPQRRVHAVVAVGNVVAGFDAVLLGHEAVQGVRQHAAVFGMFKVHRGNLTGPRSFLK